MIPQQIFYKKYRYISVKVLKDTNKEDSYEVELQSSAWPRWKRWHKNADIYVMKEILFMYKVRAWILQFTPPRVSYWIVTGHWITC